MVDEIVHNPAADQAGPDIRPEDRLREAIVTGRFQPSERLVETEVARELGVGRSAVRTALARLEHEGLVEHERHRGARERPINAREAVEILEVGSSTSRDTPRWRG
jgi:DNA-binding GntR family transcriptional regulator